MDQKVRSQDGEPCISSRRCCTAAERRDLRLQDGTRAERGKPNRPHKDRGRRPARARRWTSGYGRSEEANAGL